MKKLIQLFLLTITLFSTRSNLFCQTLPTSYRTQYTQTFIGDRNGKSETYDPKKQCCDFTILDNTIIGKDCNTGKVFMTIKLVTSNPTINSNDGSWNKRFFGYDIEMPSYEANGTQNLDHVITVKFDKQKNSYSILLELPDLIGGVSVASNYFNL